MKKIIILGSTGSIGTQTLKVIEQNPEKFEVLAISCNSSVSIFIEQILKFRPKFAVMENEKLLAAVKTKTHHTGCKLISGIDCYENLANEVGNFDCLVSAISTSSGMKPTLALIKNAKILAIANKESVICGGKFLLDECNKNNVKIIPIDSEHNSIFRIITGIDRDSIEKVIITASGGSFFGKTQTELENITLKDAKNHPNWAMGIKNTIDSNTMANKALEIIEAATLFDLQPKQIDAVIQKSQIVHAMIETKDSGIIGFFSKPNMQIHIANAISDGEMAIKNETQKIDFTTNFSLDFAPIPKEFRAFYLGKWALKAGFISQIIFNFSNEIAVKRFCNSEIKFVQIPDLIEKTLEYDFKILPNSLENIFEIQKEVYSFCNNLKL